MISRAVAVPGIFYPRREIRQLISRAETVPGIFYLRGRMVAIDNSDPPTYILPWKEICVHEEEDRKKAEIQKTEHLQNLNLFSITEYKYLFYVIYSS